jgi:membrane-associated protease RseP (regulator of RpoE activity)
VVQEQDVALLQESLSLMVDRWSRVLAVSYQLSTEAAELCGERVAPILGLIGARDRDFPRRFGETLLRAYGMDGRVVVLDVLRNSPAARAGIKKGDKLLAVNGDGIRAYQDVLDAMRDGDPESIQITLERDGGARSVSIPTTLACDMAALLVVDDRPGATIARNKKDVVVATGFVKFARSDHELAIGLATVMAQGLIGREAADDGPKLAEADRLGLYLAARAGFDVSQALEFWDRWALWLPTEVSCQKAGSEYCPPIAGRYPERAVMVRATVREILEKKTRGEPLAP